MYAAPLARFAGLRVLHRPSAPGHPPRTLTRLLVPTRAAAGISSAARPVRQAACLVGSSRVSADESVVFLSALGKIEVIIRYSVVNVLIAERHGIMPHFANVVN